MEPRTQAPNFELLRFSFRKSDFVNAENYLSQIDDERRQLQSQLVDSQKEGVYKSRILELEKSCERLLEVETANEELKVSNAALEADVGGLKENAGKLQEGGLRLVDEKQSEIVGLQNKFWKLEREVADSKEKAMKLEANTRSNCMVDEKQKEIVSLKEKFERQVLNLEKENTRLNCGFSQKEVEIAALKENLDKLEGEILRLGEENTKLKCGKEGENASLRRQLSGTFEESSRKKKKNSTKEGDSWESSVVLH